MSCAEEVEKRGKGDYGDDVDAKSTHGTATPHTTAARASVHTQYAKTSGSERRCNAAVLQKAGQGSGISH